MDRSDVLTLVNITRTQDAIGQFVDAETTSDVFCSVSSVSANEFFAGGQNGIRPEYKVTMFMYDYDGQTIAEYKNKRYSIYRTYIGKNDTIELYLESRVGVNG